MELWHRKQAQALGPRSGAFRPGQNQVQDVLVQVVGITVGDEPLDAVEVPGAVGLLDRLGAVSTIVAAQFRSVISDAQCRCCSLPMPYRMSAMNGPARDMNAAGWAPSASSLIAHASIDGADTPPTFSSRPIRHHSPCRHTRTDVLNDSGMVARTSRGRTSEGCGRRRGTIPTTAPPPAAPPRRDLPRGFA